MCREDEAGPRAALSLRNGDVCLREPNDEELRRLADLAARPEGVLPRGQEHFVSWLSGYTASEISQRLIRTTREQRDREAGSGWQLDLAIEVGGEVLGMQSLAGFDRWPAVRNVGTSSWLLREAQRRGIGTRARCAVLDFAFDRLNATAAFSWALPANAASIGISERLGYRLVDLADPDDPEAEAKYRLDASIWRTQRPADLSATVVRGAADLIEQLSS